MKKSSRALILNSLYKPNIGGVENSISELSISMGEIGFEVDILCSNRNFVDDTKLEDREINEHYRIYRYNVNGVGYLRQIKNCCSLINSILFENDYEIIVSRGYITSFCLSILRVDHCYLVPSVIFFQGRDKFFELNVSGKINYIFSSMLQVVAINASKTAVFSSNMATQVSKLKFTKNKPKELKFGVDKTRFSKPSVEEKKTLRNALGLKESDVFLLCLGRFSEIKNFEVAIESMRYLDERYKLLLVGSGPMENNYRKLISELGLDNRVLMFGSTSEPEIFYKVSDAFLMTSRYEAFGQVLLESTSSGLKVIAFEPSESIKTSTKAIYDGYDSLVAYTQGTDSKSLSLAISSSVAVPTLLNELEMFRQQYSWGSLVEEIISMREK